MDLLILLTAVLLALHRTDRRRAYWLKFALFDWAYLIASLITQIGSRLPTTMGLAFLDSKIPRRQTTISAVIAYTSTAGTNPVQAVGYTLKAYTLPTTMQGNVWIYDATTGKLLAGTSGTSENFIRIGHSLSALLLAFMGGQLSRYLYDRSRGESVLSSSDSPTST